MNRPNSAIEPASRALWVYEATMEWFNHFGVNSTSEKVAVLDSVLCSIYDSCILDGFSAVEVQQIPIRMRVAWASQRINLTVSAATRRGLTLGG